MSKAKGDVEAQIAAVRALGPAYRRVADLAEVGLVVSQVVRQAGLDRGRKASMKPNAIWRREKITKDGIRVTETSDSPILPEG